MSSRSAWAIQQDSQKERRKKGGKEGKKEERERKGRKGKKQEEEDKTKPHQQNNVNQSINQSVN